METLTWDDRRLIMRMCREQMAMARQRLTAEEPEERNSAEVEIEQLQALYDKVYISASAGL